MTDKYTDNGDGTVTDTQTGLRWQRETAGPMTWKDAVDYCAAHGEGWRRAQLPLRITPAGLKLGQASRLLTAANSRAVLRCFSAWAVSRISTTAVVKSPTTD